MNENNKNSNLNKINSILTDNYSDIYSLNIITKEVTVYRCNNQNILEMLLLEKNVSYDESREKYIDKFVVDEDKEKMSSSTDLANITNILRETSFFITHYRIKKGNHISNGYMKCCRIGDKDLFENILFAFSNIDYNFENKQVKSLDNSLTFSNKRKILIIEDDKLTIDLLSSLLEDEYEILTAGNGLDGYNLLENSYNDISLIILDVVMPVCDGIQFMKKLQENSHLQSIPIIVITSNQTTKVEYECLKLGASDFIKKPFDYKIIKKRIDNLIKLKESSLSLANVAHDELTGLYTPQAFIHYAKLIMNNFPNRKMFIVVAKIKDFKLINSIYGTNKANEVLKYLASQYSKYPKDFILARRNSSSFICLNYANVDLNHEKFESLTKEIIANAPIKNLKIKYGVYENINKKLSVSAISNCASLVKESIMDNYDVDIAYYTKQIANKRIHDQMIESNFENALMNNEFTIYYQPKIDITSKKVIGAEALVRWIKPNGEIISPAEFIPVYEHDGLISKLDEYVFKTVSKLQKEKMSAGKKLIPISVNLSRHSILQDDVVERYVNIINENHIPYECIPIELTESAAVNNKKIKFITDEFVNSGFILQIDDFGSGYSSLTSLNEFSFSTLKIDKSLIDHITEAKGKTLVEQVITLTRLLKMEVIAEGVETKEQLKRLQDMHCNQVQGFYFAKPMPEHDFIRYIKETNYNKS